MKTSANKANKPLATETKLHSYRKFSQEMKTLSQLRSLPAKRRDTLLRSLYALGKRKVKFEKWASEERFEAPQLRDWRKFLKATRTKLSRAMQELAELEPKRPVPIEIELFFDPFEFLSEIGEVAKHIFHCYQRAERLESFLTALIHPSLRNRDENKAVKEELIPHYLFSSGEKSRSIDQWVIGRAAATLDNFQDDTGKKIRRYDRVIEKYFQAAFGYHITDENVRTTIRRLRESSVPITTDPPEVQSRLGQLLEEMTAKEAKNVRTQ